MILLKERDSVDSKERERDLKWHDFFFQWFWRVLMAVIGAGVLIVLQKANILNVSVVNAADYQKIEAITKK